MIKLNDKHKTELKDRDIDLLESMRPDGNNIIVTIEGETKIYEYDSYSLMLRDYNLILDQFA